MKAASGGKTVTVYGQTEVTRDLIDARDALGLKTIYEADDVSLHDFDGDTPKVRFVHGGAQPRDRVRFHRRLRRLSRRQPRRACRPRRIKTFEREYPFGWLGILSETPPVSPMN